MKIHFRAVALALGATALVAVFVAEAQAYPLLRTVEITQSPVGKVVYQKSCKQCHGALGVPTKAAIKLDSKTPDFTKAAFFVDKKDEDLRAAVAKGKGKNMEGFADKLSKEDISAVVEYIHTLHTK